MESVDQTHPELDQEQIVAYGMILDFEKGTALLSGPAGSGKTFVVVEAALALEDMGTIPVVSAISNAAADVLRGNIYKRRPKSEIKVQTTHSAVYTTTTAEPFRTLLDFARSFLESSAPVIINPLVCGEWSAAYDPKDHLWLVNPTLSKICTRLVELKSEGVDSDSINGVLARLWAEFGITPSAYMLNSVRGTAYNVLIIDEASMLNSELYEDAQKVFTGVILVGDPCQIPAVIDDDKVGTVYQVLPSEFKLGKQGFYTRCAQMFDECVHLDNVHRSAAGPLKLANHLRSGGGLELLLNELPLMDDLVGRMLKNPTSENKYEYVPIVVWRNETRLRLTKDAREARGYRRGTFYRGEMLILNTRMELYSDAGGIRRSWNKGSRFLVVDTPTDFMKEIQLVSVSDPNSGFWIVSQLSMSKNIEWGPEDKALGNAAFWRFAYAITCHKIQGSEYDQVAIFLSDVKAMLYSKKYVSELQSWLYTAITRARHTVLWLGSIHGREAMEE